MTNKTPHLGLKFVKYNQAQKEVVVNEAIAIIDAMINRVVVDIMPHLLKTPSDGDVIIIQNPTENSLLDKVNYLGIFYNGWRFIKPQEGCMLWVMNKSAFYQYTRSSWNPILLTNS